MPSRIQKKSKSCFFNKNYYLPVASGLLFFASIYPTYILIANFIFLVPLLFFLTRIKSGREAFKGGLLFGFVGYLTIFYWMYSLLNMSIPFGILLYLLVVICFSLVSAAIVFIIYSIHSRWKISYFLFLPFLWIILESARTFGPFRLTIDHIANSMAAFPQLIQFIDITGPYGITFWLILVNTLIFETIVSYRKKSGWIKYAFATILVAVLPASFSLYIWKNLNYTPDLRISLIQPDVPFDKKMKKAYEAENMDLMISLTSEAAKGNPDLIIWPETSYPHLLLQRVGQDPEPSIPEVSELARALNIPILVGANFVRLRSKEDFDVYNAALLVDTKGAVAASYEKMYLVPFTESLPFKSIFGGKKAGRNGFLALLANFSPGEKFSIFEIENKANRRESIKDASVQGREELKIRERFGVLICYEGLFPELSRHYRQEGADFLVCMTNDAWFGRTIAPYWHASALRLRAIENRVSIARCANSGVSCFFDPAGREYQNSEIFTKGVITGTILAFPPSPPFYTRAGDVIIYVACAAVLILIILAIILKKKNR